jgi:lipopolysaccharide/colanic/teichoic acid biosynthesis glycosyltransferase
MNQRVLRTVASPAADYSIWLRSRLQIPLGILVAIVLPVVIRSTIGGIGFSDSSQQHTAIGGVIALVAGYLCYRRLHIFPGYASGGYIISSFTATFALLTVALIMLRADYGRLQLLASYLLTIAYYTFVHLRYVPKATLRFGVIANGAANDVPEFSRVIWHRLTDPAELLPPLHGVVVDLNVEHSDEWNSRIAQIVLSGTPVYHVKEAIEQLSGRVEINHLSENTLGSLNPNDLYLKVKAALDFIVAAALLIVTAPLLIVVALIIPLDTPGPALFRQQRTGFRAKPFIIYKFRTMRVAPPVGEGEARLAAMTADGDARITRLGALLRKMRIDELPQLINILKGEMSLIGPRPEVVALTRWYESEIPFYHYRHIIKPGITGWGQINLGHVAEVDDVRRKLDYDFYYVKNFSAWLDLLIVLRTIHTMITGRGAR